MFEFCFGSFFLLLFTFLTFDWCDVYVKGMTCSVHRRMYLEFYKGLFFLTAEMTSSYWFAVFPPGFFSSATLDGFHSLSWMCLKGQILTLYPPLFLLTDPHENDLPTDLRAKNTQRNKQLGISSSNWRHGCKVNRRNGESCLLFPLNYLNCQTVQ